VLKPKKNKKGNRLFTPEDLENLKMIYFLVKEKGFTLEGAKNKLKENPDEVFSRHKIIMRLEEIKNELTEIKNQL
jgi:DNA-binding transcriptional MerR regulator